MAPFVLTVITRDPQLAAAAAAARVERIGVDIERLGKAARQPTPQARISDHELRHLAALRRVTGAAVLFARLNPLHAGSAAEVEQALEQGAGRLMLPYFHTAAEVEAFVRLVDRRAGVTLLLESGRAVMRLHRVLAVDGYDEVMVGLNDLALSVRTENPFELAVSDVLALVSERVRARSLGFGFGGVAHPDDADLPVPPDAVLALHALLGSTGAWLSRSFLARRTPAELPQAIAELRERLQFWREQPETVLLAQRERLRQAFGDTRA